MPGGVSTGTLALGGLVVVAGGSIAYLVAREIMDDSGQPFVCPPGEHVGTVGYAWPQGDLFRAEDGFGEALESFGYDVDWDVPGWTACSEDVVRVVETFQRDFNRSRSRLSGAPPEVATHGLIDDPTVNAMAFVNELQQLGESWPLVVSESKEHPK